MQKTRFWKHHLTGFQCLLFLAVLMLSSPSFATVETTVSTDCVSCNGTASFTPGIAGDIQYEWFNQLGGLLFVENTAFGISSLFNLCPGLYQVQWTNGTDNGQEWFTVNTVSASAGQPGAIELCSTTGAHNLNLDLDAGANLSGSWFDPFGNPISNSILPSTAISGFYMYQLEDGVCFITSGIQLSIIENAHPGLSTTYLICENYLPFELLDVMAGNPDHGGQWFDSDINEFGGTYDPEVNVTGLFTYRIDSVIGCPPVFSTMMVIENQLPNPGVNTLISICPAATTFNMTDELNGDPQSDGQWYDADFNLIGPEFDSDVLSAGMYNYVVAGLTPCPVQESFLTIEFSDDISAGISNSIFVCEDVANINLINELQGTPTLGGIWEGPNGIEEDAILSQGEAVTGTYVYTVEGVGCLPQNAEVEITVELLPNAGQNVFLEVCENTSPIVLADLLTSADFGGIWSVGGDEINGSLVVEGGQTYNLIYLVEGDVCPDAQANYTVQSDVLPLAGGDLIIEECVTEVTIDLGDYVIQPGAFTSEWTGPDGLIVDPNLILDEAESVVYIYTIFSENTCPDDQVSLTLELGVPAFDNGSSLETGCAQGQTFNLEGLLPIGIPEGGVWETNGILISPSLILDEGVQGSYIYILENDLGCAPSTFSIELNYSDQLTAGEGMPITLCSDGNTINLSQQVIDGWVGGAWMLDGVSTDDLFDPLSDVPGVYQYVVPANGFCEADTTEVLVEVEEGFDFDLGPDFDLCENEASGAVGNADCTECEYAWSPSPLLSDLLSPISDLNLPDVSEAETFVLTITVSNGACLVTDNIVINLFPEPIITINLPDPICQGSEVLFEATGAVDFAWSENVEGAGEFATGTFYATDLVTVTGTNDFGCIGIAIAPVDVFTLPDAVFDFVAASACFPLEVTLEMPYVSDENTSYFWEIDGQIYTNSIEDVVLTIPGSYDVTLFATALNGCENSFTLDGAFDVYGYPEARFDFNEEGLSSLLTEAYFTNLSTDNELNYWDFGDGMTSNEEEPVHTYPNAEDAGYRACLLVENAFGCEDEHCEEFYIEGEFLVYVPNAFTPDMDGINDVFRPFVRGIEVDEYSFKIFNRWGEQIFDSITPSEGWVGDVQNGGYFAQNEIYTWVLKVKDLYTAEIHTAEGHVTLLR